MTALNKQALREAAEKATPGDWRRASTRFNGITATPFSLGGEEVMLAGTSEKRDAEFIAAANPKVVLALLDELVAANELLELQRFKLERQAEDLHQAKSLESIHRDKRLEVEREFRDYKDRAESNQMRLAKEVCRLEDELQAAGIGVKGE